MRSSDCAAVALEAPATPETPTWTTLEWRFDEGTGQAANDADGRVSLELGTTAGPDAADPAWSSANGCSGVALVFDGADDVASARVGSLTSFTVSAWVRLDSYGAEDFGRLITFESMSGADDFYAVLGGGGHVGVSLYDVAGEQAYTRTPNGTVPLGRRFHLAITYDDAGSRDLRIFIDGVESTYERRDTVVAAMQPTREVIWVGNRAAGDRALDGLIDNLRLGKTPLSAGSIAALATECPEGAVEEPVVDADLPPCNRFASPTGGGGGRSAGSPYTIASFWNDAAPGMTLCLADGVYTGNAGMIKPPPNLN
jgi:hypothetical protein